MNKITAHSLEIKGTQKLDLPVGARLLSVNVDHRFNKCLLWTLQDDEATKTESVAFTFAKLGDSMDNPGQYIGTFKDNSGYLHVFAAKPPLVVDPAKVMPVLSASEVSSAMLGAKPALAEAKPAPISSPAMTAASAT